MQTGLKRTTIARIAAALGFICGATGLLTSLTSIVTPLAPHGWNNGAVLFLLFALFILLDGAVSFEKARTTKH